MSERNDSRVRRLWKWMIYESVHYFVLIGLGLIGLGGYLEIKNTSAEKHTWAAMAFLFGALWLVTPIWGFVLQPRLSAWWKSRHRGGS